MLSRLLKATCYTCARSLWISFTSLILTGLGIAWLAAALIDALFPVSETAAWWYGVITTAVAIIAWLVCMVKTVRKMTPKAMALAIEHVNPDLHDALICALELEHKPSLNGLEAALLQRTTEAFIKRRHSLIAPIMHRHPLWKGTLLWIVAMTVFFFAAKTDLLAKMQGANHNGIVVLEPAATCFLAHDDITIRARASRWQPDMTIQYLKPDGTRQSFPMHPEEDRVSAITLFDVTDKTLQYRLTTSTLSTPWRTLRILERPLLSTCSIDIIAPAYTNLLPQHLAACEDITAPENSTVSITAAVSGGWQASLKDDSGTALGWSWKIQHTKTIQLMATCDAEGETVTVELARFTLTALPDKPPVIAQSEPAGDVKLKPADAVRITAAASDDYGLAGFELRYRKLGTAVENTLSLLTATTPTESDYNDLWSLDSLALKPGDMLSCMLIAEDTCEPRHQVTRGNVFFVTIVPDEADIKAEGGDDSKKEKVSIEDLLTEAKRLLRQTWDLTLLDGSEHAKLKAEIRPALTDLQLEVARRSYAIAKKAGLETLPLPLKNLFEKSTEALKIAAEQLGHGLTDDSIRSQELSLAALMQIQNMLETNKMKSDKAKGKGTGKGKDQEKQKEQQKQENEDSSDQEHEQQQKKVKQIEEAIETLRNIITRQDKLNRQMPQGDHAVLAREQRSLKQTTLDTDQALVDVEEAGNIRDYLRKAENEMTAAAQKLTTAENTRIATIHGTRALKQLQDALEALEALQRQLRSQQMTDMARKMASLAQQQQQAAKQSKQAAKDKQTADDIRNAMRQNQEQLSRHTQKLDKDMQRLAEQLNDSFPEAAMALREAHQQLENKGTKAQQKKAVNALLYKRFDRAAAEQQKAAENLEIIAESLKNAATAMPSYSLEQLRQELAKLQELSQEVRQAQQDSDDTNARQRLERVRQQAQRHADDLAGLLGDMRFQELEARLSQKPPQEERADTVAEALQASLREAMLMTAEHLQKLERDKSLKLSRESVAPPNKYRRFVEEYFKGL